MHKKLTKYYKAQTEVAAVCLFPMLALLLAGFWPILWFVIIFSYGLIFNYKKWQYHKNWTPFDSLLK